MGNCTGDKICINPTKDTLPCCNKLCSCGDPNLPKGEVSGYKWCSKSDACGSQVTCDAKCAPSTSLIQLCSIRSPNLS